MPHATTAPGHHGPRRRAVLASCLAAPLAAVLLDGCSGTSEATSTGHAATALRDQAARDSAALLEQYDATTAAHPALGTRLRPLRDQVAQHLAAFQAPGVARPSTFAALRIPAGQGAALAALAHAEQRTADARAAALADAAPELARLLASVAAAGACHVVLLQGGA